MGYSNAIRKGYPNEGNKNAYKSKLKDMRRKRRKGGCC